MSRLPLWFAIVLLGSAPGRADDGRSVSGGWVAQATPVKPPVHAGSGISITINNGKIQIDGIKEMVSEQLARAEATIKNTTMPPEVRAKLEKRLAKVRATVEKRLDHLDATDLDQLGEELGKMGEEIGSQMDDFGKDMDAWGKSFGDQLGKDLAKQLGKSFGPSHSGHHDDDDDDDDKLSSVPDVDDPDELDEAVADLGDLSLKPPQRDAIQKLRTDSDQQVAAARKALAQASSALTKQLDNVGASDAEIAKAIDAVTQQEAAIRKARILAWHNARRVLDDAQRKKVQDAAKAKTK